MELIKLGTCLIVVLTTAFLLQNRPALLSFAALTLWMLVPGVAVPALTGVSSESFAFHPATWLIIIGFSLQILTNPLPILTELAHRCWTYLLLGLVIVAAIVMTRFGSAPAGYTLVIEQMLIPVLMFWLAATGIKQDHSELAKLRNGVIGLAAFESLLAMAQWAAHSTLVYQAAFRTNYWFHPETWNRWMGTTDHPLVLVLILCGSLPLVAGLSRPMLQASLLALMSTAVIITQSRTAAALLPVGLIYVLLRSQASTTAKLLVSAAITVGTYLLVTSPLIQELEARFQNDTGSTAARGAALQSVAVEWHRFIFMGDGITSSYQFAQSNGLGTSLESSILMYAVGIGIVLTAIYFGIQLILVLRGFLVRPVRGAVLSGFMVLVIPQTFSALGVNTVAGPFVWTILILVATPRIRPRPTALGVGSTSLIRPSAISSNTLPH